MFQARIAQARSADSGFNFSESAPIIRQLRTLQRHPPVHRLALQQQVAAGQGQCARRVIVKPQGRQRQFAAMQGGVVTPAHQFG